MADDFQEKTEEASQKKLSDARKKGQVAKSQDFTSSALLLTAMLGLYALGDYLVGGIADVAKGVFLNLNLPWAGTMDSVVYWGQQGVLVLVMLMAPLFLLLTVVAIAVNVYQVGFEASPEALNPKFKKINIFDPENYKKFFNTQALAKLAFGLGKLSVVSLVCYWMIYGMIPEISHLTDATVPQIAHFIVTAAFRIGVTIALILMALGIADMVFQKWKFGEDMKMSKQEVKDERKQSEGDPQLKAKARSMMQQFTQARMRDNVPKADVIIANPIHYAIALKYDQETMAAPLVVAKGARKMALMIKSLGADHSVPIIENPPLARTLYKAVEVGYSIPPQFYNAIAEILAYVYRLNEAAKKGEPRPKAPNVKPPEL